MYSLLLPKDVHKIFLKFQESDSVYELVSFLLKNKLSLNSWFDNNFILYAFMKLRIVFYITLEV